MSQLVTNAVDHVLETARLINDPYYRVPEGRGESIADAMELINDSLIGLEKHLHLAYAFDESWSANVIAYAKLLEEYREPCEEKLMFLLDRPVLFGDDPFQQAEASQLHDLLSRLKSACEILLSP